MKKVILAIAIIFAATVNINAQSKISLGVNVGFSLPVTELANVYGMTPSAEFNAGYRITPDVELLLTAGYSNFKFRNESLNDDIHQLDYNANMNEEWTATVIPITAGVRYKFDQITKHVIPYGTAEVGAYITNFNKLLGGSINLTGSNITYNSSSKESQAGFGLALGIGTMFEITPRISVDVIVKYNFVKTDFVKDYTITKDTLTAVNVAGISTGMFLTTRAGINIKLF
ncbi:MAG: outer membrane beta-barrel protein [Ignavibacteriota bacterium]|nr:outer membrane beta-barrel protein [Ignavibacteriota bacterium]